MQDERIEFRVKVAWHARVRPSADVAWPSWLSCVIIDASYSGCRIVCGRLDDLPDEILLQPDGFAVPLKGEIIWRSERFAGVRMSWSEQERSSLLAYRQREHEQDKRRKA